MKKTVAILLNSMNNGCAERASIAFMENLVNYFDVSLFLTTGHGDLLKEVPKAVQIKVINPRSFHRKLSKLLKEWRIISYCITRVRYFWATKVSKNYVKKMKIRNSLFDTISSKKYDIAITFDGTNIDDVSDTIYRFNAVKKICFIHNDSEINNKKIIKALDQEYLKYDKIYCSSSEVEERFSATFPKLKDKVGVYLEPIDRDLILQKSKLPTPFPFEKEKINIVTAGSIRRDKGQDLIPRVARRLKESNINFKWYIIGDGDDKNRIDCYIRQKEVSDEVVLCGNQSNPYPFIKNCDIYVQPSYKKESCIALCEAGILRKAIVGTNNCIIKGMENMRDGIFVDADCEQIFEAIMMLIHDVDLKSRLEENVGEIDFSHGEEIEKIIDFI